MVRASAVRPAIPTPMWSSISSSFFWWEESSDTERLRAPRTAWVEERSPMQADPCLTDSMAYSTWRRRPSGDQTVTSVSYWLRNMVGFMFWLDRFFFGLFWKV